MDILFTCNSAQSLASETQEGTKGYTVLKQKWKSHCLELHLLEGQLGKDRPIS